MSGWRLFGRLPSIALVALGLAAWYKASSLPFGSVREPDSGFFPSLVSLALIVFGAVSFMSTERSEPENGAQRYGMLRVWVVVAALVVYAEALVRLGFILCTAAVLVLLLRGMGRLAWPTSVVGAIVASIVCYGVFTRLGVPLPAGFFGF